MAARGSTDRRDKLALLIVLAMMVVACDPAPSSSPAAPTGAAPSTAAAVTLNFGPRVEISPAAVLLAAVGETRTLRSESFDAAGKGGSAAATWSSSDPDTVGVAADGTVTARAIGSAQITASIDGVTSAPALIVVAAPAAGVTLITDDQITGGPVASDPDTEPSFNNTYEVTLGGVSAKVGDLLIGTGEKPLAGKVVAVDGSTVTLSLVPLSDLLPALRLEETIDLSNAQINAPADIVRLYDITRVGETFSFTPKPDFMQLIAQLPRPAHPSRLMAAASGAPQVSGTYMLPFESCETVLSSLPITLSDPPSFIMTINPTVDVAWTPDNHLLHWLVRAQPKATLNVSLKINAQFETKISCSATFFEYVIPIAGMLSWFIAGKVPIGLGFELGGKVIVASATVGGKVDAFANVALGIDCPVGSGCSLVNTLDGFKVEPKWNFVAPSIGNARLQPAFEVSGFVKAAIGNPLIQKLTLDFAKAKVGGKASADWSPRQSQMTDALYRSEYKLTLEAGVSVGTKLGEIAQKLGLPEIAIATLKITTDLYHSPTAKLSTDKASYAAGDTIAAKVHFDPPANLKILELFYNVDRVLLVQYSGANATTVGTETVLGTATATEGQSDFEFQVPVTAAVNASDLYAFVVPKYFSPSDELALELEHSSGSRIIHTRRDMPGAGIYVMADDGSALQLLSAGETLPELSWSRDGTKAAYAGSCGGQAAALCVMDADGTNPHAVGPGRGLTNIGWSPDGTKLSFSASDPDHPDPFDTVVFIVNADGSGLTKITAATAKQAVFGAAWSPDGAKIAFVRLTPGDVALCTVPAAGGPVTVLTHDVTNNARYLSWSPDSTRIAYADIQSSTGGPVDIYVVTQAGGRQQLTNDDAADLWPTWSPDGTKIAFVSTRSGSADIWVLNAADGSGATQLTSDAGAETNPFWVAN